MTDRPDLIDQLAAFHDDAFGWAVRCCGGDVEAGADTLQDAYVKVAARRTAFAGRSSLKTWWFAVVRLTALERQRRRQRRLRIGELFRDWIETVSAGTTETEEREFSGTVDADRLAAALSRLPARQAEVLHLVFQGDLSLSEAAAVMRVSVGSARQHYDRAKKRLRAVLGAEGVATICNHAP